MIKSLKTFPVAHIANTCTNICVVTILIQRTDITNTIISVYLICSEVISYTASSCMRGFSFKTIAIIRKKKQLHKKGTLFVVYFLFLQESATLIRCSIVLIRSCFSLRIRTVGRSYLIGGRYHLIGYSLII